jgi:23S rRNA (cytosine1962-C5)-methyltransferase
VINQKGRSRIRSGHPWVYRSDVKKVRQARSGDVVEVQCSKGRFLGRAFYSRESQIALRMVTTDDEVVDEAFWRNKLESALARRRGISTTTNAYRWVHGESDGIPSLVVDRYGEYLVLQTLSQGTERLKKILVRLLVELAKPSGILERNDPRVRSLEGLALVKGKLYGEIPPTVSVQIEGIRYQTDLWKGQKTGLFLDQRENRLAAAGDAVGKALDVFAYDGGFSMHLARTCEKVLSVDISAEVLTRLRANAELNGLTNIEIIEANAFDLLRDLAERGECFDIVVLDPPAFAKNRASVTQAERGYKEINLRALKLLRPGGRLITSTCSYHIKEDEFLNILASAAADAGAQTIVVEKRSQSRDHPILLTMPETHYLKCLLLQKL